MTDDKKLREHLVSLLQGGHAFVTFEGAVKNLPFEMTGQKSNGFDHSAWQLLEHIRIAQWDIVEFSISADHVSPKWPDNYWPEENAPANEKHWQNSVETIKTDLQRMQDLVKDPSIDLLEKIPHGTGQTILREALLIAEHNAYHLGQLVMVRKMLGIWPPK